MSNQFSRGSTTTMAAFGVTITVLIVAILSLIMRDVRQHTTPRPSNVAAAVPLSVIPPDTSSSTPLPPAPPPIPSNQLPTKTYIEVTDGCAEHFQGECLLVRNGPGTKFPVVAKLRTGVVLRAEMATTTSDGTTWYKIMFDEWLRYPERQHGTWYIAGNYVTVITEPVVPDFVVGVTPTSTKYIIVDLSQQKLYAYDGKELYMTATTSTGLHTTPTPRGTFTIYKKTPSRYMQGPLPNLDSKQYYDLPGVPWNLYFTEGGAVIHGAYWHNSFGTPYSHGCVNLDVADAHKLYDWTPVGATITVKN